MLSPMRRWTPFLSTSCILIFYDPQGLMDDPLSGKDAEQRIF
jgi:hypothetical protein